MRKTIFIASSLLIAVAGHHAHAAEPSNLSQIKNALINYQENGEYQSDLNSQVSKARQYLAQRITENNQKTNKQKLAVVLDIDETTLSNYPFMKQHGFGGTLEEFDNNLNQQVLPEIKPMKVFYQFAKQNNVAVFFVTGRCPNVKRATISNLKKSGYNHWQEIYFKPQNYQQSSVIPYKASIRKKITNEGYTVVESIGDQDSDLKGGYAEQTFKLPNPFYYIP
jgi:predicted secreted acid phosphatase